MPTTQFTVNLINDTNGPFVDDFAARLVDVLEPFEYDVVVVDNHSDDGSYEVLQELADVAVQEHTTRGEARTRALELAETEITVDCLDTDQLPTPALRWVLDWFLDERPDECVNTSGCMVNWYDVVRYRGFGHWSAGEDKYLWDYLIAKDRFIHLGLNTAKHLDEPHNQLHDVPRYVPDHPYPYIFDRLRRWDLEEEITPDARSRGSSQPG